MQTKSLLSFLALAAVAFAGCSDGPPSGDLAATNERPVVDGTVEITYQPFTGANPLGQVPNAGEQLQCAHDPIAEQDPTGQFPQEACQEAYSLFEVHFMSLPAADAAGYAVFLANATGEELSLGTLTAGAGTMFDGEFNQTADLTGSYEFLEVRSGAFVLAQAPTAAGNQSFELPAASVAVQVTGTYEGKTLTLQVSGLVANVTYTGRLYAVNEDSGVVEPVASFPVASGETVFEAEKNIADYAEFHLHVGGTSVNVYKATIA